MRNFESLKEIVYSDIRQSLRSRWFWAYSLLFGGFVAVMFTSGITESQIIGLKKHARDLPMSSDIAISIKAISKVYEIYDKPRRHGRHT